MCQGASQREGTLSWLTSIPPEKYHLTQPPWSLSRSSIAYNVVFLCSTHGPRIGRNERLAAEISIPIIYVVRKWMPDPICVDRDPLPYPPSPSDHPWTSPDRRSTFDVASYTCSSYIVTTCYYRKKCAYLYTTKYHPAI